MQDPTFSAAVDTVSHRDAAGLREGFRDWLARHWQTARLEGLSAPMQSGASSELFYLDLLVDGQPRQVVARLQSAHAVYPDASLQRQATCMQAAARHSSAPVPAIYGYEQHSLPGIGAPFLLMESMSGNAAPDIPSYVTEGWLFDSSASEQRELWHNAIEQIARLHATDWAQELEPAGARLATAGDDSLQRMLAYWDRYLALVQEEGNYPDLVESVTWLHAQRPTDLEDEGLVWGDASLRNMLFSGLKPVALLDFEFAHLGLRPFDIAFFALMDHVMAEGFAAGAPRLPGFPGIGETLDYYESVSGRSIRHREYLLRMALTYMALSTTRVYQRLAANDRVGPDDVANNPPLLILRAVNSGRDLPT